MKKLLTAAGVGVGVYFVFRWFTDKKAVKEVHAVASRFGVPAGNVRVLKEATGRRIVRVDVPQNIPGVVVARALPDVVRGLQVAVY